MVTQTPTLLPVPVPIAGNMGSGATPLSNGESTTQSSPFATVLTQAQTQQTQPGMNPLVLAVLNGLTALPTANGIATTPPTAGAAVSANAEVTAEAPGQETMPDTNAANLLAMAALCLNPAQIVAMPVAAPTPTVGTAVSAPSIEATTGQANPPPATEEIAALLAIIPATSNATETAIKTETGQKFGQDASQTAPKLTLMEPIELQVEPLALQAQGQSLQAEQAKPSPASAIPALVPTTPAQLLEQAQSREKGGNIVQAQQTVSAANLSQSPLQVVEAERSRGQAAATVSTEPFTLAQGAAKKIAVLPMESERAIALPGMALPIGTQSHSSEAETSAEGEKHETDTSTLTVISHEKTATTNSAHTFGETLQRLEGTGQPSATQTETVKPQTTDRYDVAAQVTKHLETMTAAGGRSELVLQLKPEHLGQVKITLSTSENGLSAKIVMDTAQGHQAMNSAKESLRSAFEQRGITLDTIDVALNQQAFGNGQSAFAGMQMGYSHTPAFGTHPASTPPSDFGAEADGELPVALTSIGGDTHSLNRLDFRA